MHEDDFEWKELIDTGSSCNVFRAIHKQTQTEVALKKLFWTTSPSFITREAKITHRLNHQRIVRLYGAYRKGDQAILVLEYVKHQPFRSIFKTFDGTTTRSYFRDLFEGLSYLHSHNILHRDIKPANYLFDMEAGHGKLIDFGCSELLKAEKRKASRLGTRGFRAPEVLLSYEPQTTAIDMWSSGVILLSILTGRYPFFQAKDDVEELFQIMSIIGSKAMQSTAGKLNREISCDCDFVSIQWEELCSELNESLPEKSFPSCVYDLLGRLLQPDPNQRISACDALSHPFFQ